MGIKGRKTSIKSEAYSSWGLKYQLIKSRRRTMAMEIKEGEVIVRVPRFCSEISINNFLESHRNWLNSHLLKELKGMEKAREQGTLSEDEIKLLVKKAKDIIPERVEYYARIMGLEYGRISIRRQSTRWGSCSSKKNLNFNCLLMLAPPEVLDSVVVHELCHLKEMNHSERFYREVLKIYPDYYRWNKWLKDNGAVLIKRMKGM